jgi:tRNA A-37 threonylcarbamoyl transferase component Bud32
MVYAIVGTLAMKPPVIAPRLTPPAPSSGSGRSVLLPDDMVGEQVRRVTLFAAISAFMWGFGMFMDGVVFPATVGVTVPRAALLVDGIAVGTALVIVAVLRFAPISPRKKADCGLWLTVLNAFGTTAIETWVVGLNMDSMGGPSWTATVILASAMIMPNSPRKTLMASLAAAAMGPLGVWIAHLRGFEVPTVGHTMLMMIPNFLWAGVATLPAAMFQRLGKRLNEARALGSYELVEQLGAGGMGTVWRARHRFLARDAAVKLVRAEALGKTDSAAQSQLRRFEREAQATALLRSQHSIRLFDFGAADDGSFYYVMELLEGRDLESVVRDFGPMPAERAVYLLKQICHSLAEAHARGMVHRDIKPANIFLCRMGLEFDFVKVLDFGLVQTRLVDPSTAVTETLITAQQLIGTPAYMAPEVILGKDDVDRRADVYAIGCVAFYLLTGTRVFQDGTQMQALIDHVHAEPVPPSARLGKPLPRELDQFVLDCLRKKPDDRPRDAAALLERLMAAPPAGAWSNTQARAWWQAQLPDLAGALDQH